MSAANAAVAMPDELARVVAEGWCSACGVCVATCPPGTLAMYAGPDGLPVPRAVAACTACGLCYAVCPFGQTGPDEDAIAAARFADAEERVAGLGRFRTCLVGHAPAMRERAASGGVLSWTVARLLEEGVVDAALLVGARREGAELFAYQIVTEPSSVGACSGSHYYPAPLDVALSEVVAAEMRVVVVGLPCAIKAVHRACARSPRMARSVVVTLGLACGQQKSRAFTTFSARAAGMPATASLRGVRYRVKHPDRPADRFGIEFRYDDDGVAARIESDFPIEEWVSRMFMMPACGVCDDATAETADACFMDAWLPEHVSDPYGTNIVVVRSEVVERLLGAGIAEGALVLEPLDAQRAVASQSGVIAFKNAALSAHLDRLIRTGRPAPRKRVLPARDRRPLRALADRCARATAHASLGAWVRTGDVDAVYRACALTRTVGSLARRADARLPRKAGGGR